MRERRSPSIRGHLALLVLASATPAILLAAGFLVLDQRQDRERLERNSIGTARAMVHAVDRELVSITTAAQTLATSPYARAGDLHALREQAREMVASNLGATVVLSDADGRQLMNTFRPEGSALPMHGNPAQLRQVFETAKPVISDLYTGGVLRRPIMSVDVPVMNGDRVAYDLSVGEVPDRFQTILNEQQLPAGWIGVVFDRKGTIVARTQEYQRFVGRTGTKELVDRIAKVPEGALESVTLEGIPVISVFSRSPATGWTVALGIPSGAVSAQVWRRTAGAATATAIVLALGLALAWGIGGNIAAAIRGLERPASQIGRQDELDVPPLGLREAEEVAQALVRASHMIAVAQSRTQRDPLTGLPNLALFRELATHEIARCARDAEPLSILYVDLDGLRQVNESLGHEAGDKLLCLVAERLSAGLDAADVVARVGGDDFAVLLPGVAADDGAALAFRLMEALAEPYALEGRTLRASASIGTATYPQSGATVHDLLRRADEAMYRVKSARRPA